MLFAYPGGAESPSLSAGRGRGGSGVAGSSYK